MLSSILNFSLIPNISVETFSFLPVSLYFQEVIAQALHDGLEMATRIIILTFILEMASIPTVKGVLKQPGGKSLYRSAVFLNFRNHYGFGVPVYILAVLFFRPNIPVTSYFESAARIVAVLLIHAVCYYHVHKFFHANRTFYQYHEYHHQFNKHVPPASSHAVSWVEYMFGYVLPFVLACFIVFPLLPEIKVAVYIIAVSNLLIHTPRLEKLSEKLSPVFASPLLHIEHHDKQNVNHAAPVLNLDWIFEQLENAYVKLKESAFMVGKPKSL